MFQSLRSSSCSNKFQRAFRDSGFFKTQGKRSSKVSVKSLGSGIQGFVVFIVLSGAISLATVSSLRSDKAISIDAQGCNLKASERIIISGPCQRMLNLPGRPSTLSADERIKLKELWRMTFQVFGRTASIHDQQEGHNSNSNAESDNCSRKQKSFFNKTKTVSDLNYGKASEAAAANDKHGQGQTFETMLKSTSPEEIRRTFWDMVKHDDPDALLLRFLRARKWDVNQALTMMMATLDWRRREMRLDEEIMRRGEADAVVNSSQTDDLKAAQEASDFLAQMRMGKSFLHGTDREARPICWVRVRLHKQGKQSQTSLERYTVFMLETARLMLQDRVDTAAIVFDMTDFSLANMDYAPVKFMIKCFEANYPESLGVVLVHKSPWVFHGIWKVIRSWLDPVVASKVHFTKNIEELSAFIAKEQVPLELGGKENWEYRYVEPKPGENAAMSDDSQRDKLIDTRANIVDEYEKNTQAWLSGLGDEAAAQRRSEVFKRLRQNYWLLDPHIRARSLYDRTKIIGAGGQIDFYPRSEKDQLT